MQPLNTAARPSSVSTIGCAAALGQVDDRQPAMAERDRPRGVQAGAVRAAGRHRRGDPGDRRDVGAAPAVEPDLAGDTAHGRPPAIVVLEVDKPAAGDATRCVFPIGDDAAVVDDASVLPADPFTDGCCGELPG